MKIELYLGEFINLSRLKGDDILDCSYKSSAFLNEKNLSLILNSLDEGIHIVNQKGTTIMYNKKASELDGLDMDEVLGANIFDLYPSLTLETSTLMQTIRTERVIEYTQQTFINSKGKKITTINTTLPIRFNNNKIGAMEISRDITQLEELLDSINNLRNNLISNNKLKNSNKEHIKNNTSFSFIDILGDDRVFKKTLQYAIRAAASDSSILIYGETGTGKEMFAQSIHNASLRRNKPFIAQNCAALPKDLLEGILFGTERGGFTGAVNRPGLFEQAQGGTILLDEINSMDLALQAKLLRVLQENKLRRVGAQKEIEINVRVIATTNVYPDKAIEEKKLREDLFYRLNVVYLEIPPLRERKNDISLLTNYFIKEYNKKFKKNIKGIEKELKEAFYIYNWPGNIRELKHVIESTFNLLVNEETIVFDDLPIYIKNRLNNLNLPALNKSIVIGNLDDHIPPLDEVLENIEIKLINKSIEKAKGNISEAARNLKISRQSLQYKLRKYGIEIA
jgi:arginine utilization regulatory protein